MTTQPSLALVPSVAEVEVETELDRLADTIRAEIGLIDQASQSWVEHAILAGEALIQAQAQVALYDWGRWLEANVPGLALKYAGQFMRAAFNKSAVLSSGARTSLDFKELLPALPYRPVRKRTRATPELLRHIKERRNAGLSWNALGRELDLAPNTVRAYVDAEYRKRNEASTARGRKACMRRKRAAELALERQERDQLAAQRGGDISVVYASLRKSALLLDRLIRQAESEDVRFSLDRARYHLHKTDNAITAALRNKRVNERLSSPEWEGEHG